MIYACSIPHGMGEHSAAYTLLSWVLHEKYRLTGNLLLARTPQGKPFLRNYPGILFNISHCAGLVACAVSHTEVGVDVEKIRPYPPRMPRRILAPSEQEQLLKSENREDLFFRFWTLKESYGKALGVGIGYPFREIHFQLGPVPTCNVAGFSFAQTVLRSGFILTACQRGTEQAQTMVFLRHLPEQTGGISYEYEPTAKPERLN